MDTINIENVKGIRELKYILPEKKGVYILTGENGAGKTTLLAALNRIGDKLSFQKFFNTAQSPDAKFTYNINGERVTYSNSGKRWCPHPDSKSKLINDYAFHVVYYLAASEMRMFQQQDEKLLKTKHDVSESMKTALNNILGDDKFSNLKYIQVKSKRGRQRHLRRDNKLYVIKGAGNKFYSEISFSLGERLMINALDFIENVSSTSLLLIDEIELALHPIAQVKFYNYLKKVAIEKNLAVIISTHSSTLIKYADKIHYLEKSEDRINVIYDCKPAYVLKDLSVETDNCPDCILLVEDEMASYFMHAVWKKLRLEDEKCAKSTIKILPVGGYIQVLSLFKNMRAIPPFSTSKLHCFLDKDVEDTIESIRSKVVKTMADQKKIDLFNELQRHFYYLPITPELGVWNELLNESNWFMRKLTDEFGCLTFNLSYIISVVNSEENSLNERERAKGCFKNLFDRLNRKISELTVSRFHQFLFEAYVANKWTDASYRNNFKGKILSILNKRSEV